MGEIKQINATSLQDLVSRINDLIVRPLNESKILDDKGNDTDHYFDTNRVLKQIDQVVVSDDADHLVDESGEVILSEDVTRTISDDHSDSAPTSPLAGGSDTQIQYNDNGSLAGDSKFTFDKTNKIVTLYDANNNVLIGRNIKTGITGFSNTVIGGTGAGAAITSGTANTLIGAGVAASLTTGAFNVMVGKDAGSDTFNGSSNTILGEGAGDSLTTAASNVILGRDAGCAITAGAGNVMIGRNAAISTTEGVDNVAIGRNALHSLTTTGYNIAIGYQAGYKMAGDKSVLLGYQAGYNETNSNKLYISNSNTATPLIKGDFGTADLNFAAAATFGVDGGVANYSKFEDDGTLAFHGDATVWDDLQFSIFTGKVPAVNNPTWETFTTNTLAYAFDIDDYISLETNELPHGWIQDTTAHPHCHFAIKTAQVTGSNRFVKIQVDIAYGRTGTAWTETTLTEEATIPTASDALQSFYLDLGNLDLSGFLMETQIAVKITRIDATGGTEYADDVYITQFGVHYEIDTVGSRAELTK